jgi:predicted NUDIX family phosphoesterase
MKNKDQVLIVPTTYVSHIGNNFVGTSLTTERSYCLYDSTGIYKPLYEIEKKICLIRISIFLLIQNSEGKFLVKELHEKSKVPYIELGIQSYVKSYSGNYRALYNQINHLQTEYLKKNTMDDFKFIGTIRDLANNAVSSVLGNIYYVETDDISYEPNRVYEYKWYSVQELIDRYNKATSWSKILIDMMVDKSIYKYL